MIYNSLAYQTPVSNSISVTGLLALILCLTLTFAVSAQSPVFVQKSSEQSGVKSTQPNPTSLAERNSGNLLRQFFSADSSDSANNLLPAWVAGAVTPGAALRYAFADNGDDLYVIGGLDASFATTTAVRRYSVLTNTWTTLAPIPASSEGPSATVINNKIYATQGSAGPGFYIYDIVSNTWTTGVSVPGLLDRYGAAMGSFNNKVYVIGGSSAAGGSNNVQVYDIASAIWSAGTVSPAAYQFGGYVQNGQYLYCVGSYLATPTANSTTTMRLDMTTAPGTWLVGPVFIPRRADFALATLNNKLYAIGGDANGGGYFDFSAQVDELSLSTYPSGTWVTSPDNLPSPRQANQAGFNSTVTGAKIWTTGGFNGTGLSEHLFRTSVVTAAGVTVSGRVLSGKSGISRATVSITDSSGTTLIVKTNSFGMFSIDNLSAGQTYILNVAAKGYSFAPQVVTVTEAVEGLEFTAL